MLHGLGALVRKDLLRQVRDVKSLVIYLLVPLLLTLVMGISFGGGIFGGQGISAIPLALAGGDLPDGLKDQVVRGLQETELFTVTWTDSASAAVMVREGDVRAALILPDALLRRFFRGEDVVFRLWKDPNSQVKAGIVETILNSVLAQFQANEAAYRSLWPEDELGGFGDLEEPLTELFSGDPVRAIRALRQDDGQLRDELMVRFERGAAFGQAMQEPAVRLDLHDRQDWSAEGDVRQSRNLYDYFLPSFAVFFMMWGTAAIIRDLHREREHRTLARLLAGPVTVTTVALSKWTTAVIMASAQLLVLLLAGGLLFGVRVGEAPIALGLVSIGLAAASASVYLVLGLLASTEKAMDALTTVFTLLSGMVGGNFFPVDLMPAGLLVAGRATFNYWGNRAFSNLITRGEGFLSVIDELLILTLFASVGLVVAVAIFRVRQRRGVAA
jgi:ABC-type Na+ efflux pump permease subunit